MTFKVLLVDDCAQVRRTLRIILEDAGYAVAEASNAQAGLATLDDELIDLVITDILMPGMDGIGFLQEVKRTRSDLPVICMSGGGSKLPATVSLTMSQAFGAARILYKPFREAELLSYVGELIRTNWPHDRSQGI